MNPENKTPITGLQVFTNLAVLAGIEAVNKLYDGAEWPNT